jgi:hypothetical protein
LEPAAYLAEAQVAAADRDAGQIRTAMAVAEAARALEVVPVMAPVAVPDADLSDMGEDDAMVPT